MKTLALSAALTLGAAAALTAAVVPLQGCVGAQTAEDPTRLYNDATTAYSLALEVLNELRASGAINDRAWNEEYLPVLRATDAALDDMYAQMQAGASVDALRTIKAGILTALREVRARGVAGDDADGHPGDADAGGG